MGVIYLPKRALRTRRGRALINQLLDLGYRVKLGVRPSSRFDRW
jgi:hypothetical protein